MVATTNETTTKKAAWPAQIPSLSEQELVIGTGGGASEKAARPTNVERAADVADGSEPTVSIRCRLASLFV